MECTDTIRLHATPHPSASVRRAGFPLDHPYLEQCWTPLLGPTSIVLLRRIPELWRENLTAELPVPELAASIGLGRATGRHGPLWRTLDRLVRFRFADMPVPGEFDVFTELPPVHERLLERLPAWNRRHHDQLLGAHLDHLATPGQRHSDLAAMPSPTAPANTPPVPSLHR